MAVISVAAFAGGCAAGHIAPLSKAPQEVSVGLSEAQIELRVQADALRRTPWDGEEAADKDAGAFSVGQLFGILVDGMGPADTDGLPPSASDVPALSADATRYLSSLETRFAGETARADAVNRAVEARAVLTRRFISAASHVVAGHRMTAAGASDPETVQADLSLITDVVARLKDQYATFAEVASALGPAPAGPRPATLTDALTRWDGEIDALEILKRSIASGRLS